MSPRPQQEEDVVPTRRIALVGAATVAITVACVGWVALVMRPLAHGGAAPLSEPPAAREVDRSLYHVTPSWAVAGAAAKRARLESYGWVDRARGRVHIPIERAMAIIAAEARP